MRRFLTILTISLMLAFGFAGGQAWAAKEPASPEFTLEQAVEKAKANSQTLRSMKYDIDRGYEVRQYVGDKLTFVPYEASGTIADTMFKSLMSADLSWRMAKRNYEAQEDSVVMQTNQAYYGLLQEMENIRVAESQVANAGAQHGVAAAYYRVGLLDKKGMLEAEEALAKAKANLVAANKALEDSYQQFNQLVGLWPEDRPVLLDKPGYKAVEINNLGSEVAKVEANCPSIWLAQQRIDLAKISLALYDFNNAAEPYKAKQIEVTQAEIAVENAAEQMGKLVRTLYYTINQVEEQYTSAQNSVKTTEESLRVAKVKYDVGMATIAEVRTAEAALAQAEKSLFDLACQHEILALAFQKPWAYAASSNSSSDRDNSNSDRN